MTVHLCGLYSQTQKGETLLLCRNSSTNGPKGEFYCLLSNQNILLSWSESSWLFFPPRLSMKRPSTATAPATCTTAATSPFELRGVVWATVHSITPKALRPSSHTALESRSAMYFAATSFWAILWLFPALINAFWWSAITTKQCLFGQKKKNPSLSCSLLALVRGKDDY